MQQTLVFDTTEPRSAQGVLEALSLSSLQLKPSTVPQNPLAMTFTGETAVSQQTQQTRIGNPEHALGMPFTTSTTNLPQNRFAAPGSAQTIVAQQQQRMQQTHTGDSNKPNHSKADFGACSGLTQSRLARIDVDGPE